MFSNESNWRQKAKIKWVEVGDANTCLFHCMVKGRRVKSVTKELELENGQGEGEVGL